MRTWLVSSLMVASAGLGATTYPVQITDLDNQKITLNKEPQHVILQDGRDIMAMALLDRDNPFRRVVAWNNLAKKQDVQTWAMLKKAWPDAENIIDMGFNDRGEVNLESVIAQQPDLMIAQLRAKPALQQTGVLDALQKLHIPVMFIDYELHPAQNTARSITLLGTALNQEAHAKAFTDFYTARQKTLTDTRARLTQKATVFIEPIAGNSENCCFTHSHNGWGGLVEAVGGKNIGSALLPGASGFVDLEKVIAMRPDVYIMTGSKRHNDNVLPLGYNVSRDAVAPVFTRLTQRRGVDQVAPVKAGRVSGVYHHFYNHPYNIIGMEVLAKAIYPAQFASLQPEADYHHIITQFTQLPDDPIVIDYAPDAKH
ncbi:ABC transporter substrate-binding protein [Pantoea sp. 1.19]|uniref:ABC transporter substrate-binding protein n=1 Tax=Pantoea sp. 1.19 TaxID=1925589 RepID=UPI0009489D01|nr:ABC transporter substrate-binding protein [Pantoea sp. 1.19]